MWQRIVLPASIAAALAIAWRLQPLDFRWPLWLVLLAIFWLVPAGLRLAGIPFSQKAHHVVSFAFVASCACGSGIAAGLLSLPWSVFCLILLAPQLRSLPRSWPALGHLLALGQLWVGTLWAIADRFGWDAFGFGQVITRLTAAHFHVGGFLLPLFASLLVAANSGKPTKIAMLGIGVGFPLTAVGITLTRLGIHGRWEGGLSLGFSACCVWLMGLMTHYGFLRRNYLLIAAGLSGSVAMALAMSYAARWWIPPPLDMPHMWAIHGSLQVFGFATLGLWGFRRSTN
jgi:hypothetical protein